MPFNFWFVHIPPGGHIDGMSGDCDLNREKSSGLTYPYGQGAPLSPTCFGLSDDYILFSEMCR